MAAHSVFGRFARVSECDAFEACLFWHDEDDLLVAATATGRDTKTSEMGCWHGALFTDEFIDATKNKNYRVFHQLELGWLRFEMFHHVAQPKSHLICLSRIGRAHCQVNPTKVRELMDHPVMGNDQRHPLDGFEHWQHWNYLNVWSGGRRIVANSLAECHFLKSSSSRHRCQRETDWHPTPSLTRDQYAWHGL